MAGGRSALRRLLTFVFNFANARLHSTCGLPNEQVFIRSQLEGALK
jgi:hypothetical protein